MRFPSICALTASLGLLAGSATAQSQVSIQFQNGFVSVSARNAPLRTILQEWARVGRTNIVNAERVTGSPLTIELVNVPEQEALATLLRGITGYVVGARQVASTGPSSFDRIMILPGNSATVAARPANSPPVAAAPPPAITFVPGDADDDQGVPVDGRVLSAAQLQNQIREANARAAGQQGQPAQPVQPEPAARTGQPAPGQPTTQPTTNQPTNRGNPFFTGPTSGRAGAIDPVPQQRNPLRPNGDPEP